MRGSLRALWRVAHYGILPCIVAGAIVMAGCGRRDGGERAFNSDPVTLPSLTCVVADRDSDALLLGSMAPMFTRLNIADGSRQDFPLPAFSRDTKTYDIHRLTDSEWLVAKRNCGLIYVAYEYGPRGARISHTTRVTSPLRPLPAKGSSFSTYSIIEADSLIVLGTSNGMMYLTRRDMDRMRTDSVAEARHVRPLEHLRKNRVQFAQESMFLQGDSILTVTDHGIYRVALSDFADPSARYATVSEGMRCWNATLKNDTLAVIHTPDLPDRSQRELVLFDRAGRSLSRRLVPVSANWTAVFADSIRTFGAEGDFLCFRAGVPVGSRLYFIRGGELRMIDSARPADAGYERVRFCAGPFVISDRQGLFRIKDDGKARFLGDVTGVSGIRGMTAHGNTVYVATADGVYSINGSDLMFSTPRKARMVESNNPDNDRVESVYAIGDTLLIGSRNGLHYFHKGRRHDYAFPELKERYESPYVCGITRDGKGQILLKTLNAGTWTLKSLSADNAVRWTGDFPAAGLPDLRLSHDVTGWADIRKGVILAFILILAVAGAGSILYVASRRRHRHDMKRMRHQVARVNRDVAEAIANAINRLENKPYAAPFRNRLMEWNDHIMSAFQGDTWTETPESRKAYNELEAYCTSSIDKALGIAKARADRKSREKKPKDGDGTVNHTSDSNPLGVAMDNFCRDISGSRHPMTMDFYERLEWLTSAWEKLNARACTLRNRLDGELKSAGARRPEFLFKDLQELWNVWVAPWAVKTSCSSITEGTLRDNPKEDPKQHTILHTILLTTASFFGCDSPQLDIEMPDKAKLKEKCRSMVNLPKNRNDLEHLGTVYKYWAQQVSAGVADDSALPECEADLLWMIHIRDVYINENGSAIDSTDGKSIADVVIRTLK